MAANSSSPVKRTAALFLGHMLNDGFASFFAPLLPLLIEKLHLSLILAGSLGTLRIATNSLLQPGLGALVDRSERPWLVVIGPMLTVTAMSFIGRVSSSVLLLIIMILAGIGTAMFHPAAASLVAAGTAGRRGLLMAFFSSGGTLGGAVAPVFIVSFVDKLSLAGTPFLLIPGILTLAAFAILLKRALPSSVRKKKDVIVTRIPPRLFPLWFAIVLSSACSIGFSNFLAVLIVDRGGSPLAGGGAISLFLLAGAAGGFFAGNLSDRFGRKPIIFGSLVIAAPFYLAFLHAPLSFALPLIGLAGIFSLSSVPVGVVAAQESMPGRTGLVSGLVMGLAWGLGGFALTPIGWLADRFGLAAVMNGVSLLPLIAAVLVLAWRTD